MNIHWIQHVPFEGLGCIEPWLAENGHAVSCTRLWAGDELPLSAAVDGLIVMGGSMGVYDEAIYPWLAEEKAFIKEVIDQNKPVLGICLGAQLIADVLGAKVWPVRRSLGEGGKNDQKEIGFFECRASVPLASLPPADPPKAENDRDGRSTFLPDKLIAFHWHGDTFGIPDGAVRLASSEATENQAFLYKDNVLALQFHLETTGESLLALYENAQDEITDGPFIQCLEEMRPFFPNLGNCNALMFALLKQLF